MHLFNLFSVSQGFSRLLILINCILHFKLHFSEETSYEDVTVFPRLTSYSFLLWDIILVGHRNGEVTILVRWPYTEVPLYIEFVVELGLKILKYSCKINPKA